MKVTCQRRGALGECAQGVQSETAPRRRHAHTRDMPTKSVGQCASPLSSPRRALTHRGVVRRGIVVAGICLAVAVAAVSAAAGDLTRYRGHVLGSTLDDVLRVSEARSSDVRVVHEGPNPIQTLEWRTPYTRSDALDVDPARSITFAFLSGQLYEVVVDYDRIRIEGLTTADLVAGVATLYGAPTTTKPRNAGILEPGSAILAHWEDVATSVLLVRGPFDSLRLIVRSIELEGRARQAIAAAVVRHEAGAPARLQEEQATAAAAARAERARNKAGFRP